RRELQGSKESGGSFDRQGANVANVLAPVLFSIARAGADPYLARFRAQTRTAALATDRIAAIPAEKDAHVQLVLLTLEVSEETVHAQEAAITSENEVALRARQVGPGNVERDLAIFGEALQLGEERAVFRLRPGFDGAFVECFGFVGDDEIGIEINGVAET